MNKGFAPKLKGKRVCWEGKNIGVKKIGLLTGKWFRTSQSVSIAFVEVEWRGGGKTYAFKNELKDS